MSFFVRRSGFFVLFLFLVFISELCFTNGCSGISFYLLTLIFLDGV